ncbi:MAG: ABC transporter permease, partial [Planctomycetota bacterium]
LLSALLAGLGVLNGQLLAALERSKEMGVLKALGTRRSQIAGMVAIESVVIGVLGGGLGLVLGGALTPLVISALQALSGLPLPLRLASGPFFLPACLLGAVLLCLLAGLYPAWRMNRMDAVRAVRAG